MVNGREIAMKRLASFREFHRPSTSTSIATAPAGGCTSLAAAAALVFIILAAVTRNAWWLLAVPVWLWICLGWAISYSRTPACDFRHPLYSLMSDCVMFKGTVPGRIRL